MSNILNAVAGAISSAMGNRTLTCSSSAIPQFLGASALIPVSLTGVEGIDSLFEYSLILKTPDGLNLLATQAADYELDSFIGKELTCNIELEGSGSFVAGLVGNTGLEGIGAGSREITGLITGAKFLREEGRHILYEVTLRPWLHLATLTSDCKIFQDKTVVEILDAVLADYSFPVDKRLIETYPKRDYQCQYNETDFDFISRLCQEWGISYFFEHSDSKHRLVFIDSMGAYKPNPSLAYQQVNFYTPGYKVDEEYLHAFTPTKQLTSGRYATTDYSYTAPKADLAVSKDDPRNTAQNNQEVFEFHASNSGSANFVQPKAGPNQAENNPQEENKHLAAFRAQLLRSQGHRARASGNLRGMVPGYTFALGKHPQSAANAEYLILNTRFTIEEVAQESQVIDSLRGQAYKVNVELEVFPTKGETYRPATNTKKPKARGIETALVVGPEDQNIWTDEYGRIKIQFHWDRYGTKDQHSSCWVRTTEPWSGNQLGATHLPRIGQEVLISFIDGDVDLPICTGRINNQLNMPPWKLPEQQALSGFRSRELTKNGGNAASGRSNHLILDDTEEKIQAQLRSDHQASQLSLGHITRIDDNAGRKDARGEGFELRTDAHGAIRAKDGLLITTEARNNASAHITDMGETVQRLTAARDQHETTADLAKQHQAQAEDASQEDVTKAIKSQNEAIRGKDAATSGTQSEDKKFPELSEPHLVLASPAGIETTTPKTTHIAAGEHIALTSGGHTSLSVGKSLMASVQKGIRFFSYKLGLKLVAASGDIDIKALEKNINILAKMNITQTANTITISGKEEVTINGGGSYTTWKASGIEHGTNGSWSAHAASHGLVGAKSMSATATTTFKQVGSFSRALDLSLLAEHFAGPVHGWANVPYEAYTPSGKLVGAGTLDDAGQSASIFTKQPEELTIFVGEDGWNIVEEEIVDSSIEENLLGGE